MSSLRSRFAASSLLFRFFPILLLALLLRFPVWSVQGAANGLLLWFNVVLPTLSPFIICTQAIVAMDGVRLMTVPVYPILHRVFGLSVQGSYVMFCGMLCGYPLGARLCADFKKRGAIDSREADYLLAICNHPSPMFLLGYVAGQIPFPVSPALLFACLYLPILPVSLLAGKVYGLSSRREGQNSFRRKSVGAQSVTTQSVTTQSMGAQSVDSHDPGLEEIIHSTCETMVLIGGYIMLFSILATWIRHLEFLSPKLRVLLIGAAEITTGVNQICAGLPADQILPAVVAAVAFGGFSGIFQTKSVIKNAGLSIRHYVLWKTLHAGLACLILTVLQNTLPRLW